MEVPIYNVNTSELMKQIRRLVESSLEKFDYKWEWVKQTKRERISNGEEYPYVIHGIVFHLPHEELCFRSETAGCVYEYHAFSDQNAYMSDLKEQYAAVFSSIADAINNSKDSKYDLSYTTSPVVALFKYGNKYSGLAIKKLNLDTILLQVTLCCYNWIGDGDISCDRNGNMCDRSHIEEIEVELSPADLANPDKICNAIMNNIKHGELGEFYDTNPDGSIEYLMDIDNVNISIVGYTIDASSLSKDEIRNSAFSERSIGPMKSFRIDKEVVTRQLPLSSERLGIDATQFARLLVLWAIPDDRSNLDKLVSALINGDIMFSNTEKERLMELIRWINIPSNKYNIREDWGRLFERRDTHWEPVYPCFYPHMPLYKTETIFEIQSRIVKEGNLLSNSRLLEILA